MSMLFATTKTVMPVKPRSGSGRSGRCWAFSKSYHSLIALFFPWFRYPGSILSAYQSKGGIMVEIEACLFLCSTLIVSDTLCSG